MTVNTIPKRYGVDVTYLRRLLDVAGLQRGFVTPANARVLGVPSVELPKLAARGALEHRSYGLYRLAGYPAQPGDEYVEAVLWAGGGHISHESAMVVWELADVNPRWIDLTVPRRVRRSGGTSYRLWIANLGPHDVDEQLGIAVTTPLRSVIDAAGTGSDPRLIEQALENLKRRRLASVGDVRQFEKTFAHRAVI
jgi:predicted transcriptional regulator of viral defense system